MSAELGAQKRGRSIAMSDGERDEFLALERTCRVATVGADGPHATPLWFHWDGQEPTLWLYSIIRSRRWAELRADPRIGVVMDGGLEYLELRGVEISGTVEPVGELPRTGEAHEVLDAVERAFSTKYFGTDEMFHDGRHGWLRVTPAKIVSWDFRKLAAR